MPVPCPDATQTADLAAAAADADVRAAQQATYDAVRAAADGDGLVTFSMVRGVVGAQFTLPWTDALQVVARGDAALV